MIGSIRAGNLTAAAADVGGRRAGSRRGGVQLIEVYMIPLPVDGHIAIGIRGDLDAVIGGVRAVAGGESRGLRFIDVEIVFLGRYHFGGVLCGQLLRSSLTLIRQIDVVHIIDCAEDSAERHHGGGNAFPVPFQSLFHFKYLLKKVYSTSNYMIAQTTAKCNTK